MKEEINNKINDLHDGKVVRIFKDGWFYKIGAMETMASIVVSPQSKAGEMALIEEITLTSYCTMTQAELFIEHILL